MNQVNIVLHQPEIPQNTGNIGRVCVGFNCHLHLIRPFGFELTDKNLKRAGLDYWAHLKVDIYESWEDFQEKHNISEDSRCYFMTTKASRSFYNLQIKSGDYFVFGKETRGLPPSILEKYSKTALTIPFPGDIRSFNLANSVSIVASESHRQMTL